MRAALAALALVATFPARADAPPIPGFTTEEAFDASRVAAYRGDHEDVYRHIDAHLAEHLAGIQRWIRQRSVSATNEGVREMAELVASDLHALGFGKVEIVPTKGHPVVLGRLDAGQKRTLLVYMMYDVQPEESGWSVPAFDGALVDGEHGKTLVARGAANQKGPERAFLNAVASILATRKKLPVNLVVVAEGEEELGSLHLPDVIVPRAAELSRADAVFFPLANQDATGAVDVTLGVKGIVLVEIEARGGPHGGPTRSEIHSSLKAGVDAPAWRLVQGLSTLVSPDGNTVLVPGWYDAIRPPTREEQLLVNGIAKDFAAREVEMKKALGIERFAGGLGGRDLLAAFTFGTTINVNGLWTGYTGPGSKTILPHVATARLDIRLVPNQRPQDQVDLLERHLAARGFDDLVVRRIEAGYPPAQTSLDAPFVQATIAALNKRGLPVTVEPRLYGSAPYYLFTETLGLPIVAAGLGYGGRVHAPDEFLVVDPRPDSKIAGLAVQEKFYVDLLYAFAAQATSGRRR
jgi:acetylornithine deacetylase/succinyl-diaminopimelate desuccinylase-like protein